MGFDALAVDVDRAFHHFDQHGAEAALPHPALDAFAGQRQRSLRLFGSADDDFRGGTRVHGKGRLRWAMKRLTYGGCGG